MVPTIATDVSALVEHVKMARSTRTLVGCGSLALALLLPACNPDSGATGDTDGDTSDSGGGAGTHGDCDQYIACLEKVNPSQVKNNQDALGPSGACWDEIPETVQKCLN